MAPHDIYFFALFGSFEVAPQSLDYFFSSADLISALQRSELPLRVGPSIKAILDPILGLIGLAVAGVSWGIWRHKRKQREAVLDSAWREVMADPHYLERRHIEERRLAIRDHQHEGR